MTRPKSKSGGQFSKKEAAARFEAALKGARLVTRGAPKQKAVKKTKKSA
jgi:hypothetical protein